jgi:universal stress protein A
VATDLTEGSLVALDEATRLAGPFGASIHLLHVVEPAMLQEIQDYPFGRQTALQHMMDAAQRKLRDIQKRYHDFPISPDICQGIPALEIVRRASDLEADLIVVATPQRTGLARLVLQSTTASVLRTAPCPVLSVRVLRTRQAFSMPGIGVSR